MPDIVGPRHTRGDAMSLPVVNAFWIGPALGERHAACISSFLQVGHRLVLHVYGEPPSDTPYGVDIADASKLIPFDRLPRHKQTGSYALASDIFRYEVLGAGLGLYVDCDVFCIRPIEDDDYIFGHEGHGTINGAVLKLPRNSAMLSDLRAIGTQKAFIPPWYPERRRRRLGLKALLGLAPEISELPWGVAGPAAVTYYAKKHNVHHLAKPSDYFYPVHYSCADLLLDAGLSVRDLVTPRTVAIHLYNEALRDWPRGPAPGSPLQEMIASQQPSGFRSTDIPQLINKAREETNHQG